MYRPKDSTVTKTNSLKRKHDTAEGMLYGSKIDVKDAKMSFFDMASDITSVANFVKSVCRRCFTISNTWGSRRNHNKFMSRLDEFLSLNKGESMTMSQIIAGMKVSDFAWMGGLNGKQTCMSPLTQLPKILSQPDIDRVLSQFIFWIFTSFVIPLISVFFYVTEGEGQGSKVFYFRKPVWRQITSLGCEQVKKSFAQLSENANSSSMSKKRKANGPSIELSDPPLKPYRGKSIHEWLVFPSSNRSNENTINTQAMVDTQVLSYDNDAETSMEVSTEGYSKVSNLPQSKCDSVNPSISMSSKNQATAGAKNDNAGLLTTKVVSIDDRTLPVSGKTSSSIPRVPIVRFVPKASSVRAITNMKMKYIYPNLSKSNTNNTKEGSSVSSRTVSAQSFVSDGSSLSNPVTASALYNCLHVFRQIYLDHPYLIGFGVLGNDEIYLKLKSFKSNLNRGHNRTTNEIFSYPNAANDRNDIKRIPEISDDNDENCNSLNNSQPEPLRPDSKNGQRVKSVMAKAIEAIHDWKQDKIQRGGNHTTTTELSSVGPFYVAVLDLEKCYDNVDTTQLYDLMKDILKNYSIGAHSAKKNSSNIPLGRDHSKTREDDEQVDRSSLQTAKESAILSRKQPFLSNKNDEVEYTIHKYSVTHKITSMERVITKNIRYVSTSGNKITFRGIGQ